MIADFNGDGNLDLAVCNLGDSTFSVLLGNGDGTFGPQLVTQTAGAISMAVGDFNRDGKLDLAIVSIGVQIWLGNGDGSFTETSDVSVNSALTAVTADTNGDGKLDIVVGNGGESVSVALGNGDGTFQAPVTYATAEFSGAPAVADFNGDGKLDIAVSGLAIVTGTNNGPSVISTLLGNGDGTFQNRVEEPASSTFASLAAADFNGDGVMDIGTIGGVFLGTAAEFSPSIVDFGDVSVGVTSALGSPQSIVLSGVGQAPSVKLSPSSVVFTDQKVGTKSAIQEVALINAGNVSLSITSVTASGEFSQHNNCGSSLPGGTSCTISVIFAPTISGTKTGLITVTDNASGSPQTVSLTGTGIVFELSPSALYFGRVPIGQTPSQNVTLTNSSKNAQTVGGIRLTGNHAGDFTETNNCGSSLGAGGTCTITVTFAPTKSGSSNATLEVSGGGANQNVSISGTGTE